VKENMDEVLVVDLMGLKDLVEVQVCLMPVVAD
jgi:hypothetical protein